MPETTWGSRRLPRKFDVCRRCHHSAEMHTDRHGSLTDCMATTRGGSFCGCDRLSIVDTYNARRDNANGPFTTEVKRVW